MKLGMTIVYLKCRADLNFEVNFNPLAGTNTKYLEIVNTLAVCYSRRHSKTYLYLTFFENFHLWASYSAFSKNPKILKP